MVKLAKTTLLGCTLIALTALPAAAQLGRLPECERNGGRTVNGKCEMPAGAPQAAPPAQRGGAQEGNQGGARAGGTQQGTGPQNNAPQETGRGARGPVPQGNVQQGSVQPGDAQRGRGGAQQGGPQQGNAQQGNAQQGRVQQGNDRNNNFGQRDNGQYGNYGQRDNGNTYGSGNNGQYGNYGARDNGRYGNNFGRSFDQNEFNRRYYGRYGDDPNNFQRNRQIYRTQQRWHERYPHDYVYADDSFYRDCRTNNEVGGAVVGAILGGILGNSASRGQGGATLAGIILGGAGGAALAGNLDCEDRTYVYPTYYEGFERGRRQASYPWRNERTGHYGTLLVGDYYRDQDNYRCATYTQTIYVRGEPRAARGHACRQDDGTWVLVD